MALVGTFVLWMVCAGSVVHHVVVFLEFQTLQFGLFEEDSLLLRVLVLNFQPELHHFVFTKLVQFLLRELLDVDLGLLTVVTLEIETGFVVRVGLLRARAPSF